MTTSAFGQHGRRALLLVALGCVGAFAGTASAATTYHVRSDGGDPTQCTGKADAAYPGSGTGQVCAWKHPFHALPPGRTARIAGGDTLVIGAGSYMMGIGAPDTGGCSMSYSYDCHLARIPSGPSATQPTRILGKGHDAGCAAPPELWATERAYTVFDLRGSSNVEIGCFDVTDHSPCIQNHGGGAACGSSGQWGSRGLIAQDSSSVTLRDLVIRGMANKGVQAGRLHNWTMERVTIRANGWVGWDGDIGAFNSSNSGNIVFRQSEISWNGCTENYPSTDIHACWAQRTGGYGDGLGTHQTGGHWLFEDTLIHHNTSDGIDLLYMADGGSVTLRRVWAEGNAGNQVKTKGDTRIENSVIVGNCAYFEGKFSTMVSGDHCRALGNALSIGMFAGDTVEIVNNTISSQGDCLVVSGGGDGSTALKFANNTMIGEIDYTNTAERSCVHYAYSGTAAVSWTRNHVSGVKHNNCPSGSVCDGDPKIASRSYTGFDPTPLADSPLIDRADGAAATAVDYHNRARNIPDIGAVEYGATSGGGTAPVALLVRVARITTTSWKEGRRTVYRANVEIVDGSGRAVSGATVSGSWTNAGVTSGSAVTDALGQAKISGGSTRMRQTATFCVTSVTGPNMNFDGVGVCGSIQVLGEVVGQPSGYNGVPETR